MSWQKRKKQKCPPFVMIYKDMLKHPKWQKLKATSMVAYIYIKSKAITNNQEEIFLSFKEMEPVMTHPTFFNALTELENNGFIEKTQFGGLFKKRNKFKLSDNWKQVSTKDSLPSNDIKNHSSKNSLPVERNSIFLTV